MVGDVDRLKGRLQKDHSGKALEKLRIATLSRNGTIRKPIPSVARLVHPEKNTSGFAMHTGAA
jgi:hypothetical protein